MTEVPTCTVHNQVGLSYSLCAIELLQSPCFIYPTSHDVPQNRIGGVGLDSIGTSVRYGDTIALVHNG